MRGHKCIVEWVEKQSLAEIIFFLHIFKYMKVANILRPNKEKATNLENYSNFFLRYSITENDKSHELVMRCIDVVRWLKFTITNEAE